jgi:Ni/Co efflux regulator RcnB
MKIRIARFALAAAIATLGITGASAQGHGDDHGHDQGKGQNHGPQQQSNFHFNDQARQQFQQHYKGDVNRYQSHPDQRRRPNFSAGQQIPRGYAIRAVPRSYYTNVPPPRGYQYGYYNGYVVAYNPTTRIIADVLDLVTGN